MTTIETTRTVCGITVAYDASTRMLYPLTDCCGASSKGLDGYVGCRACYKPVEAPCGLGVADNYLPHLEQWVESVGCPCPAECASHTLFLLTRPSVPAGHN